MGLFFLAVKLLHGGLFGFWLVANSLKHMRSHKPLTWVTSDTPPNGTELCHFNEADRLW